MINWKALSACILVLSFFGLFLIGKLARLLFA
jgi:hypothetical protein